MATFKQKQAFKEITENHRSVSSAMRVVGYADSSATKPSNLTNSTGWKELCDEYGLTDDLLVNSLVEDIKAKPKNRKAELELGFKVRGRIKEAEGANTNNQFNFFFDAEQLKRIARRVQDGDLSSTQESDRLPDSNEPKI